MPLPPPVRYRDDLETIAEDEQKTVDELNKTFDTILETTSEDYGHAVRGVHAKAHGVLAGTLTIDGGLLPELAQGLFAKPGSHPVRMRISTNPGDILHDSISLPRGLAVKVLDVEGERLPGAEGATQDFVMVNGPVFLVKTADQFLGNLKLLAKTTDVMEGGKKVMSTILRGVTTALGAVGIESPKLQSLGGAPNAHPLGETYFSATPYRYGDYVAKFSVAPVAPALTALTGTEIDASDNPNAIREAIAETMRTTDAVWEFRVQLCRDSEKQPIEDPTVKWDEAEAPFVRVGTITVPAGDSWNEARVQEINEELRFAPWTGLAAHRPLGNINRSRRDVYKHSSAFRARFNGCPIHEPGRGSDVAGANRPAAAAE